MLSGRCTNHPKRVAVGVCILCREVICIECSTPIDGIHRCHRCIAKMERAAAPLSWEGSEASGITWIILLASFGGLTLYWLGLSALLWG